MNRILVVEDDIAISDLIVMNLRVAGYECADKTIDLKPLNFRACLRLRSIPEVY